MLNRLRRILLSVPAITAAGLLALYLAGGFVVLPAVLKWQVEKQVPERLGQQVSIGAVRFNPLVFRLGVDDLAMSDAEGRPLLAFRRLLVDFELRSVIDRAWVFASATLEAPVLHLALTGEGENNFTPVLERLRTTEAPEDGPLPRLIVKRLALTDARVDFSDQRLAPPLVAHIEPLQLELDDLSTLPAAAAPFRLTARTAAGESLVLAGALGLHPVAANGTLALGDLAVATLVRGLSRLVALDSPAGTIGLAASFDVALAPDGALTGTVQDVELDVAKLSVAARGAAAPLLALETLSLAQGRVDFDRHEATIAKLLLAKGRVAAVADAQGAIDWAQVLRTPATVAPADAAPQAASADGGARAAAPSAAAPWKIVVASASLSDIAAAYSDAASGQRASVAALGIDVAPTAEIGPAGTRIGLDQPKLSLAGARLENGTDVLGLPEVRLEARRATLDASGLRLEVTLDAPRGALANVQATQAADGLDLRTASFAGEALSLVQADGKLQADARAPELSLAGLVAHRGDERAAFDELSLAGKAATLASAADGSLDLTFDTPRTSASALALTRGVDGIAIATATVAGDAVTVAQAEGKVSVDARAPDVSLAGLVAHRSDERAAFDELTLAAKAATLASAGNGRLDLALDAPRTSASALALNRGADGLEIATAALGGDALTVAQADGRIRLSGGGTRATLAGIAARQDSDRIALQDAAFDATQWLVTTGGATSGPSGVEAHLAGVTLRLASVDVVAQGAFAEILRLASASVGADKLALDVAQGPLALTGAGLTVALSDVVMHGRADAAERVGVVAQGASAEILRLASASIGADALALELAERPLALTGAGLTAALTDVVVNSPADAAEMARVGSVSLAGGTLDLLQRTVTAERLAVADGKVQAWIDVQGKLNGLVPIGGAATAVAASDATRATPDAPERSAPWRVALESAALERTSVGFEDRRALPALAVGLDAVHVRVADLDTASATPMQLEARATVASGGEIQARGTARLDNATADLQVALTGVALSPAQRYLAEIAELRLASGTVSAEGRLRYGDASGAGARLAYEGSFALDRLLLEEVEPTRPFLAWDSVATGDVALTLEPNRVDVGELRVAKPSARLIIAEDQTVNLTDVLKKPAEPADDAGASGDARSDAATAQARAAKDDPFPVTIARVRVSDGSVEFADMSLRPRFAARMHDFKGVVTGLGSDPDRAAKLQFDARVDEYGTAKVRGQMSVLRPEASTEIDMTFRNLAMTSLSPYVVKFAGYRIASGRLALDLRYKVSNGKLLGKNKIVLKQVELGEKVKSPDAIDVPLDLAIALLKDADGVIDVGLPVSGDLNNREFDYGELIGKAIGNMLGRIVTAPFAALGAMFGSGEKKLDTIEFEPGSDAIAPPEREKLETVARALKDRPTLRLMVPPTFALAEDAAVLKSLMVRTDIVQRIGGEIAPGEDPGPIDTANPRVQRAIEAVFGQHYAPGVLGELKRRAVGEAAAAAPAAAPAQQGPPAAGAPATTAAAPPATTPAAGAQAAATPAATPPPAFYQGLLERLIAEAHVTERMLAELADRRGEAIVRELTTVGGVPADRVVLGERHQAPATDATAVALQLELQLAN